MPFTATADLDLRELDKGFAKMTRAGRNLRPVWNQLEPAMKQDQLDHFKLQEGVDGPWAPLAAATLKRRRGRRGKKVFSKKFAKGFSIIKAAREMAALSKIPYAAAHRDGETVGKGAQLPAREFLYLSEPFIAIALPAMRGHLEKAFRLA